MLGSTATERTPLNKGDATFYFLDRKRSTSVQDSEGLLANTTRGDDSSPVQPIRPTQQRNLKDKKTELKIRKVPVKVEPKVYFANERTFLSWLHTSIILAAASLSIVAFADQNPWSQVYGILLLPVSIAFILYALRQYTRRAKMIRRREPGPYEDLWGPSVLALMLMMSIVTSFLLKVYSLS